MTDSEARLAGLLSERYRIEREIGRGGMARVFLAEDLKHSRRVAIKVLHPEIGAVLGADRFLAEIRTTAQLHHPNILPLFDSGEADGLVFYVMPYVEGENLRDQITREGQLGISDTIRIASEVADALDHAHKHDIIHRDIKPENILIQDEHALVADFGIAIAVRHAAGDRITQTGISLGTPQYMSPEQAAAERQLDGKTDQYSLASVVYEMLAGEPPFTGPNSPMVISRMMTEPVPDLARRRASLPEPVATAVYRALSKVPGDRFPTIGAFADALRGESDTRFTAAFSARASKRRAKGVALVAAGVAAGALAMWIVGVSRSKAAPIQTESRRWTVTLDDSLPMAIDPGVFGIASRAMDISPNGRAIVYESPTARGRRLVAVNLLTGASSIVRGAEPAAIPRFSPDGNSVAATLGDSALMRFGLADGSIARIVTSTPGAASVVVPDLTWHPNGFVYFNGGCAYVPAAGGTVAFHPSAACNSTWIGTHAGVLPQNANWMLVDIQGRIGVISTGDHADFRPLTPPRGRDSATSVLRGSEPRFVAPGYLVYVNGNTLYAAPFDVGSLRLTGEPRPVLGGVRREQSGAAQYAISNDGTLIWAEGPDGGLGRFVWTDVTGRVVDTLRFVAPAEIGSFVLSDDGRRLLYNTIAADGSTTLTIATLASKVVETIPIRGRVDPMRWFDHDRSLGVVVYRPDGSIKAGIVALDRNPVVVDTTQTYVDSPDEKIRCYASFYGDAAPAPVRLVRLGAPRDSVVLQAGTDCRFSPDGRYAMWRAADGQVLVTRTDSLASAKPVRTSEDGGEAMWSPDGKSIGWRGAARWMRASAPGPSLVAPSDTRLMFIGDFLQAYVSWSWAPDGRLLLLSGDKPSPQTRLEVITNFGAYIAEQLAKSR